MKELSVIPDGALLIRNGVIEDAGPSRRIENLANAKNAVEIEINGRIVMPAFVDPDAVLVYPSFPVRQTEVREETPIRALSLRRLEVSGLSAAANWTRYGSLTVGAHTGYASDLRNTAKVLRVHQACQSKPIRIRSIFSPHPGAAEKAGDRDPAVFLANLIEKWLPAIRKKKLAAIVEFTVNETGSGLSLDQIRDAAGVAAALGYTIRIRSFEPLNADAGNLIRQAGAVAVIAPPVGVAEYDGRVADSGCVHILTANDALRKDRDEAPLVRHAVDEGSSLAMASGYRLRGDTTFNPQFMLYLACGYFGLSPEEAIVATTYNAACSLRMSHVTGSLEPGKSADLVVMDVPDYRDLPRRAGHSDASIVVRAGQTVYRRAPLILD